MVLSSGVISNEECFLFCSNTCSSRWNEKNIRPKPDIKPDPALDGAWQLRNGSIEFTKSNDEVLRELIGEYEARFTHLNSKCNDLKKELSIKLRERDEVQIKINKLLR